MGGEISKKRKPEIKLEDFQKLDFRVCQVIACEEVVKSQNFLKLTVDDGQGQRTIMSTIRSYYKPEDLIGKLRGKSLTFVCVDKPDQVARQGLSA